jgi:hypothetical protein
MPYITRQNVQKWAGPVQFREGLRLFEQGSVKDVAMEGDWLAATISQGERILRTRLRLFRDGSVDSACPCRDARERGLICAHVVGAGLAYADEVGDPRVDREERIGRRRERERMSGPGFGFLRRLPARIATAIPAKLQLWLAPDWLKEAQERNFVSLAAFVVTAKGRERCDRITGSPAFTWSAQDEQLLYILEDLVAPSPLSGRITVPVEGFLHLLSAMTPGEFFTAEGAGRVKVSDQAVAPLLRVSLDAKSGEIVLRHELDGLDDPLVLATRRFAWVHAGGTLSRLEAALPPRFQGAYRAPVRIPRDEIAAFLEKDLPALGQQMLVDAQIAAADFTTEPGTPAFRVVLAGSPERLTPVVHADYGGLQGPIACRGLPDTRFRAPDPKNPRRFLVRNEEAERAGLAALAAHGIKTADAVAGDALESVEGAREVMAFLGHTVPALKAAGIEVEFGGDLESLSQGARWLEPQVEVRSSGEGWFDVSFRCGDGGGGSVSIEEIDAALRAGAAHLDRGDRTLLLDRETMGAVSDLLGEGDETRDGRTWRISEANAGYMMALLNSLRGVRVEADEASKEIARKQNREAEAPPVDFPGELDRILRGYQKDGVRWMRYLEAGGFCGILADDMGLGKTIQALAWIRLARLHPASRSLPALVVCPTSLIENWAIEASRFTPDLKVLSITGSERHALWDEVPTAGLVVTSYALLRRDIDRYRKLWFSVAVLDEAQHIKRHATQNAKSAKALRAHHRLVLTGTPIENGVSDLWSIMDYLMPGYLGSYERFRLGFEQPITAGGRDGAAAQSRLRKKVHPFLLRRLKREVASELPPRIEKIAYCTMTRDQQLVYARLLEQAQREVTDIVSRDGFSRSRFAVLRTLTKLRQACCHLDLLKLPDLKSKDPSGKLDLLHELLEEAIDGGHRVLVFSQFVSMLTILRKELKDLGIPYSYLDGETKDRIGEVTRFNRDPTVPVFLISLKAGGTGLNLTGADMVIHYDPWWNPAVEDQATDRAHRIGQEKTVYAIKLITRDTVEEKVLALQQRKRAVIEAALSNRATEGGPSTWPDVAPATVLTTPPGVTLRTRKLL